MNFKKIADTSFKHKFLYVDDQYFYFSICQPLNGGLLLFCRPTDLKKFPQLPVQQKIKLSSPKKQLILGAWDLMLLIFS